ncbi:ComEA family DNA-binding protein [Microbacterium sp. 1P10UB]|uniref:helix-hairpin-helix domain-containing protein n=1 Tax=unclassified Microbacterium TaxID=2609290 RepID=UPI00399FC8D6
MSTPAEPPRASPRRRLGVGAAVVVVLVALAGTVGIGILRSTAAPTETVAIVDDAADASDAVGGEVTAGSLYVHVLGAVAQPGLFVLPTGSRVVDAVAAASGFLPTADRTGVNLARPLSDGEQLRIPAVGEVLADDATDTGGSAGSGSGGAGGGGTGDGRVNLNTADEAALDTLPRIGPAMAQRIIQWRDDNGRFTSVEDLLAVPGIGEKMLESLRELVTV